MISNDNPIIYRRRYVPDETILLKDDIILSVSPDLILTKWTTLKPRRDIARGLSAYFIDKGIKVSKVYDRNNQLVYWYCDIIRTLKDDEHNTIVFEDLLIDVIVYENGSVRVADIAETADAYEEGLITKDLLLQALRTFDRLMETIHTGQFIHLQKVINDVES